MNLYKYETHFHTAEASLCARTSGAEIAQNYKALGYTGIFVTDHFYGFDPEGEGKPTWKKHVEHFCHGYEVTAQAGAALGLDVFLGWEYAEGWAHFLTYGLDKDWLLANPDMTSWTTEVYFDRVHADGGFIVHAHPFREHVDRVTLFPGKIDAVEVLNANRIDEANQHALDFAVSFDLLQTAGSDLHKVQPSPQRLCGVTSPWRLTNVHDYLAVLRSKEAVLFDETPDQPDTLGV